MTMPESVSDETLMALADGELDIAEAGRLRARFAAEPELAARFALFAETRALASAAYRDVADERPPASLVEAIRRADRAGGTVVGLRTGQAAGRRPARSVPLWSLPIAASLALAIGLAAGALLGVGPAGTGLDLASGPAAHPALAAALDRTPSGASVSWSSGGASGDFRLIATHRTGDGAVCREADLVVATPIRAETLVVACRRDGRWQTEMALAVPRLPDGGFAPASGPQEAIERHLADLGSPGALSADEERAALARLRE